jgi:hypothetical protein
VDQSKQQVILSAAVRKPLQVATNAEQLFWIAMARGVGNPLLNVPKGRGHCHCPIVLQARGCHWASTRFRHNRITGSHLPERRLLSIVPSRRPGNFAASSQLTDFAADFNTPCCPG